MSTYTTHSYNTIIVCIIKTLLILSLVIIPNYTISCSQMECILTYSMHCFTILKMLTNLSQFILPVLMPVGNVDIITIHIGQIMI